MLTSPGTPILAAVLALTASACTGSPPAPSPTDPVATATTAQPTTSAAASPTEDPTASPAATEPTAAPSAGLSWTEATTLGGDGETFANTVAGTEIGFVAVGTGYAERLPNLGPSPAHEGRVWVSADGVSWEDVTPGGTFESVDLEHVLTAGDGALRVLGTVSETLETGGLQAVGTGMWESTDGSAWDPVVIPFDDGTFVHDLAQGGRGSVALVSPLSGSASQVWYTADGRSWDHVEDVTGAIDVDAGDEGFVLAGDRGSTDAPDPYVIASGDGMTWIAASAPPDGAGHVAALGGDWILLVQPPTAEGEHPDAAVWRSANGLEWAEAGTMPRATAELERARCFELIIEAVGAGPWIVTNTSLSYPCSEGGFVTHGTQRISTDGTSWTDLPFPSSLPETGGGSAILGAAATEAGLIAVGQSNRRAAFWLGTHNGD